jgi:hypothetical protein
VATGYLPLHREISVAGGVEAPAAFALLPMQGRFAHLAIATHLPAAEVVVDGELAGRTPLSATITLPPGAHRVELRRAGYLTVRRELSLGDGAVGEVSAEPEEDAAAVAASGGSLALTLSETHALVAVDGRPRGVYTGSLRLAPGVHRIRVERGGFAPVEREVEIAPGGTTTVPIRFEPNPDTLVAHAQEVERRRVRGIVTAAGGAAIAVAGAAVVGYNAAKIAAMCNPFANESSCTSYQGGEVVGGVGIAVGTAALVAGTVLLATRGDPHRYDRPPSGETLARLPALPVVWAAPGSGGVGMAGRF